MTKLLLLLIFFSGTVFANIQLIKKENKDSNTTLLVIGGIHGDEPGGYFAASILATRYKIKSKNLWIVPNLNRDSIVQDKRGINGDMNRKFSILKDDDKDKKIVEELKKLLLDKKVSLILNLHDGRGFYRKEDSGNIFNPAAWGQTCVIDQCKLNQNQPFGDLGAIASGVKEKINSRLIENHHTFDVRNTNTKFDDETMQHSLTYFAVTNNKPAFAIESSKNLSTLSQKVFYHLLAIEEFMNTMGIVYEREFNLDDKSIDKIIAEYGNMTINDNFSINLSNIKKSLSFVPIKSSQNQFKFSNPLGEAVEKPSGFDIFVGNQKVSTLATQTFKMADDCSQLFDFIIDDKKVSVKNSSEIFINDDFTVVKDKKLRVNIIGYRSKDALDESEVKLTLQDFDKNFSLDKDGKVYRVEFYKNSEFCSMIKIHFK